MIDITTIKEGDKVHSRTDGNVPLLGDVART